MAKQEILLESGTNEVEIAEFVLCGQSFGINVAKVREFIPYDGIKISELPMTPPAVAGMYMLRGKAIPLIHLDIHLDLESGQEAASRVVVVTEFNNMTTSFVADHIKRIHRVSWQDFMPMTGLSTVGTPHVVGTVNLDQVQVLVLDFEHIIGEIFPESVINYDQKAMADKPQKQQRADMKILFAEDSAIIRKYVGNILKEVGYQDLTVVGNGQDALDVVAQRKEQAENEGRPLSEYLNLVLSDIEMPKMDGLTLCRRIKKDLQLDLPVVMFSSLINQQMASKCEGVGADAYASKPETEKLIELIDNLCLPQ